LAAKIRRFEQETGMSVLYRLESRLPKIGEAVKMLMSANGALDSYRQQLEYSANGARALLEQLERAKQEVDKIKVETPKLIESAALSGA
jgi:hypothetical protein